MLATADRIAILSDQSTATAFAALADKLTTAIDANLATLMTTDEPEPVHKARVALRRFRVALFAFAPVVEEDLADALRYRSRTLFQSLGGLRDADVMASRFAGTDLAPTTEAEAAQQRRKARRFLKRKKAAGFRVWVLKRLSSKTSRRRGKKAKALREAPVTEIARLALDRAWASCLSNGPDLQGMKARARHTMRKDLKRLRYLSEFFADLWPGGAQDAFLRNLRHLQNDLGELTDIATAQSLGHEVVIDTSPILARASMTWQALLAAGPWWA